MYVFFNVNSESETHFRRSEPETLDNQEKIPDYREFPVPVDEKGHWI